IIDAGAAIAVGVHQRHTIEHHAFGKELLWRTCSADFRSGEDTEPDLVNMKIVILVGEAHKLPTLGDGGVAWSERQANSRPHRVKMRHVHEGAGEATSS